MDTLTISSGISINEIGNDSYLTIIYGKDKDNYSVLPYNIQQQQQSQSFLDKAINTGIIGKVGMAIWTSPITQNIASKALPNSVLGRINSSIYDIMADGKISVGEVAEDFIGNCTNVLDNMATDLGFPTPSGLYNAIKPNGTGVISKDFLNLFAKKSKEENDEIEKLQKENEGNIFIIKLKLITSDDESLPISIPTRKTEKNFNIPVAIANENVERSFNALIVNNKNQSMYDIKSKLREMRAKQEHVDIYISDSDVKQSEGMVNCLLSDLKFNTEDKNSINCSLSFVKVPEWTVKIDSSLPNTLSYSGKKRATTTGSNIKNKSKEVSHSFSNLVSTQTIKGDYNIWTDIYQRGNESDKLNAIKECYNTLHGQKQNSWVTTKDVENYLKAGKKF